MDEAIRAVEQRVQSEYTELLDGKDIEIDRLRALYDSMQNRCDDLQTRCDNLQHGGDNLFAQGMEVITSMQAQIDQGTKTIDEKDAKLQAKNQEIVAWTSSYERIPETRKRKKVVENLKYEASRLIKTVSRLEKRCKRGKEIEKKRGPALKYPTRTILVYINGDKEDQDRDAHMTDAGPQANPSAAAPNTTPQHTTSALLSQQLHAPLQQSQAPSSAQFAPQYAQQDGQKPNQTSHQSPPFSSTSSFPNGPSLSVPTSVPVRPTVASTGPIAPSMTPFPPSNQRQNIIHKITTHSSVLSPPAGAQTLPLPRISLEHGIHGFEQFSMPKTCSMDTCRKCYPDIVLPVAQRIFNVDFLPTGPAPGHEPMPSVPILMIAPVTGHTPAATDNFFLAAVQQLERGLVVGGSSTKSLASLLDTPAANTQQHVTGNSKSAPSDQSNALVIRPSALHQKNNSKAAPSTSKSSPPHLQPLSSASQELPPTVSQDSPHSATSKSHSPPSQPNTSTSQSTISTGDGYEIIYGLKIRTAPPKPRPTEATPKVPGNSPSKA